MILYFLLLALTWQDDSAFCSYCLAPEYYAIWRREPTVASYVLAGQVGATQTHFTDTATVAGKTYCYRVTVYNATADVQSSPTEEVCAMDSGGVKTVPSSLLNFATTYAASITIPQDLVAARVSATSIQLAWSRITDPKVKYVTVRVSVNGQPYALVLDSKTFPPTSTFTHANLGTGTYRYQLRVWDQADKLLGESNESNMVTI